MDQKKEEEEVVFRTLSPSKADVNSWLDHVELAFSEKKPKPLRTYFAHHLSSDPWAEYDGIQIAEVNGQIVATVRVFHRNAYFGGKILKVGGIGEVSTNKNHRGKGYAAKLLEIALNYMKVRKFDMSSLHAGIQGYYTRFGWKIIARYYATTTLSLLEAQENATPKKKRRTEDGIPEAHAVQTIVTESDLKQENQLEMLLAIHQFYSRRFFGPFVRNLSYWKEWIIEDPQKNRRKFYLYLAGDEIRAYLFVRLPKGEGKGALVLSVMEFGCCEEELKNDGGKNAFVELIQYAAKSQKLAEINFPLPINEQFHEKLEGLTINIEEKLHYQQLTSYNQKKEQQASAEDDISISASSLSCEWMEKDEEFYKRNHIFWEADNF